MSVPCVFRSKVAASGPRSHRGKKRRGLVHGRQRKRAVLLAYWLRTVSFASLWLASVWLSCSLTRSARSVLPRNACPALCRTCAFVRPRRRHPQNIPHNSRPASVCPRFCVPAHTMASPPPRRSPFRVRPLDPSLLSSALPRPFLLTGAGIHSTWLVASALCLAAAQTTTMFQVSCPCICRCRSSTCCNI
jgi:hypothetical protein